MEKNKPGPHKGPHTITQGEKNMNYAEIKNVDVANGPGVRVSLFVSGCPHHCPGCFNPESWDFGFGKPFDQAAMDELIQLLKPDYIKGFSVLGGEPFAPENQEKVMDIVCRVRETYPDKEIWCWTGYKYEDLVRDKVGNHSHELLMQIDVLVDGPFIEAKKDLGLRFRGSSNQRIINVPASLLTHSIVQWEDRHS